MNKLQFNFDEDSLYSPLSPDVVDISSDSENGFLVEPGNILQIEERFRANPMGQDAMTAFIGPTAALLFPSNSVSVPQTDTIDTAGTRIEQELMELVVENQLPSPIFLFSFIDSEFEEATSSPDEPSVNSNSRVNSYGRPTAAILPTPRNAEHQPDGGSGHLPTYPPNFHAETSSFQPWHTIVPVEQDNPRSSTENADWTNIHVMPMYEELNNTVVNNMTPLVIQLPPRGAPSMIQRITAPAHPAVQIGFPFHVTHSPNLLLIPVNERMNIRLFPTVMPNVAGYCDRCNKSYDQVALETLGDYLAATAYEGETVRDRGVRSRAFKDGFEAALFCFKSAGLSEPQRCDGAVVQP